MNKDKILNDKLMKGRSTNITLYCQIKEYIIL
jgi:hypothetical protein